MITTTTLMPVTDKAKITTDRLLLRTWQEGDVHTICQMMQDSDVNRYLVPHKLDQLATIEAIAKKSIGTISEKGYGYFICQERVTGHVVGMMGLNYTEINNRYFPCYTISWILGKGFGKKGYAQEAARAMIRYASETCKIPKVFACTVVDNQASINVMERIGMQRVDTFVFPGIETTEHVLYEISTD